MVHWDCNESVHRAGRIAVAEPVPQEGNGPTTYFPKYSNVPCVKAIEVDAHLRVRGAPAGTVYALGDASTIETDLVPHLLDLVEAADKNKDGKIDFNEWQVMGMLAF